jgi:hypothetical protein
VSFEIKQLNVVKTAATNVVAFRFEVRDGVTVDSISIDIVIDAGSSALLDLVLCNLVGGGE